VKIHLVYKCHDLGKMEFYSRFTPLGLGTITAQLRREGFDATLVNLSAWSWPRVRRFFEAERPDVVGVSAFTFNRHEAMRVAAHGLPLVCVNPAICLGAGDHLLSSTRLVRSFLLGRIPIYTDGAVGIVDVKSYYIETAADVADRVRLCLKHAPAERLVFAPDCGLSQTARWAARQKLANLVSGVKLVRSEQGIADRP